MKVIDLLNKIANGEEVPKRITIGNSPFELTLSNDGKHYGGNTDSVLNNVLGMNKLNDEVEIIEEDKKIRKIELENDGNTISLICKKKNDWTILDNVELEICNKINEIIDYLEENKQ